MIHTLISQLALDRAKTILENADFWGGPGAAKTSAETVTILRALGGDDQMSGPRTGTIEFKSLESAEVESTKPERPASKASPKADESKPADI